MTAWLKNNPLAGFFALSALVHLTVLAPFHLKRASPPVPTDQLIEVEWREEDDIVIASAPEIRPAAEEPDMEKEPVVPLEPLPVPQRPLELAPLLDQAAHDAELKTRKAEKVERSPGEALESYVQHLRSEIQASIRFPEESSQLGQDGAVEVVFALESGGKLIEVYIPRGGAGVNPLFQREAVRAVRQAAVRFGPFPEELREEKRMTFRLPVTFLLY